MITVPLTGVQLEDALLRSRAARVWDIRHTAVARSVASREARGSIWRRRLARWRRDRRAWRRVAARPPDPRHDGQVIRCIEHPGAGHGHRPIGIQDLEPWSPIIP